MNDRAYAEAMFYKNIPFVRYILKKYFPAVASDEDAFQEGLIGLWKACLQFDVDKAQLSTYAARCISNEVLMMLRRRAKEKPTLSIEGIIPNTGESLTLSDILEDPNATIEPGVFHLQEFIKNLNERDTKVVRLRLQGLTEREASEYMGVSQSYYSRLLKSIKTRYEEGVMQC